MAQMQTKRVAHVTTVHNALDTRIFYRECSSLVKGGYDVFLISPYEKDCNINGIEIQALSVPRRRLERFFVTGMQALQKAWLLKADIYHFHDPELVWMAFLFRVMGRIVIFDMHEDLPKQILDKEWIPDFLKTVASWLSYSLVWIISQASVHCIAAYDSIERALPTKRKIVINNYPLQPDFNYNAFLRNKKRNLLVYCGLISKARGISEILSAIDLVEHPVELVLAGRFKPATLECLVYDEPIKNVVEYRGWLTRNEIDSLYKIAGIGLLLFHPVPHHLQAQPNKMFEYMIHGLPIVASNIPYWQTMIGHIGCCIFVDPLDPLEIATAIEWLISNPEEAMAMGESGRIAVNKCFSWSTEEKKLLGLYSSLIGSHNISSEVFDLKPSRKTDESEKY